MNERAQPSDFGDLEEAGDSVSLPSPERNAQQEQQFAVAFVSNGGKGTEAATTAGYAFPERQAYRLLTRPRVLAMIRDMCRSSIEGALPLAVKVYVDCMADEEASWETRMKAADKLMKLGDVAPPTPQAPAPQLHVHLPDSASGVIGAVWANRNDRMSSIAAPMPDTLSGDDEREGATIEHRPTGDGGGG